MARPGGKSEIDMEMYSDALCPLCSQVYSREKLHTHIAAEEERVRTKTIRVIQAYHQGWSAEHGACLPCWKSFRDAGRILNLIQQTKPKRPGDEWRKPDAPAQREDVASSRRPILSR